MHIHILTDSLKSSAPRYGCWKGFRFLFPTSNEDTLKQSKNLSIFSINQAVSIASFVLVSLIASATVELKT